MGVGEGSASLSFRCWPHHHPSSPRELMLWGSNEITALTVLSEPGQLSTATPWPWQKVWGWERVWAMLCQIPCYMRSFCCYNKPSLPSPHPLPPIPAPREVSSQSWKCLYIENSVLGAGDGRHTFSWHHWGQPCVHCQCIREGQIQM